LPVTQAAVLSAEDHAPAAPVLAARKTAAGAQDWWPRPIAETNGQAEDAGNVGPLETCGQNVGVNELRAMRCGDTDLATRVKQRLFQGRATSGKLNDSTCPVQTQEWYFSNCFGEATDDPLDWASKRGACGGCFGRHA